MSNESTAIPLGDGKNALAIDRPTSINELRQAVRTRAAEGQGIYPQGGCTALNYGGIPAKPGVAISTLGLARVIDYPHEDMTITVEAGITLAEIDRILGAHNQRLCIDAPDANLATIGGIYATNWTGATADVRGAAPMNQITFSGFSAASTGWQSYDKQITPVPEPATYGACFVAFAAAFTCWRRSRPRAPAAA